MDVNEFKIELISRLSVLEFVESYKISKTKKILKVRVFLTKKGLLSVYYNMVLRIQSFVLIINRKRVWGIDRDNRHDWHEHTINNPDKHEFIEPHNIEQIIKKLEIVWKMLNK